MWVRYAMPPSDAIGSAEALAIASRPAFQLRTLGEQFKRLRTAVTLPAGAESTGSDNTNVQ